MKLSLRINYIHIKTAAVSTVMHLTIYFAERKYFSKEKDFRLLATFCMGWLILRGNK